MPCSSSGWDVLFHPLEISGSSGQVSFRGTSAEMRRNGTREWKRDRSAAALTGSARVYLASPDDPPVFCLLSNNGISRKEQIPSIPTRFSICILQLSFPSLFINAYLISCACKWSLADGNGVQEGGPASHISGNRRGPDRGKIALVLLRELLLKEHLR